ncbi:transposase [Candidatus Bathyarchaeota archaeon]|nr:transposase [Candidatus Bathyarchaeota archaeon]
MAEWFDAVPVIPVRRDSRVREALRVGRDFVARGVRRLVRLFRKRWSVERLFGRAKEWLLLDGLRVRGLGQVTIHVALIRIFCDTLKFTLVNEVQSSLEGSQPPSYLTRNVNLVVVTFNVVYP